MSTLAAHLSPWAPQVPPLPPLPPLLSTAVRALPALAGASLAGGLVALAGKVLERTVPDATARLEDQAARRREHQDRLTELENDLDTLRAQLQHEREAWLGERARLEAALLRAQQAALYETLRGKLGGPGVTFLPMPGEPYPPVIDDRPAVAERDPLGE